MRIKTHNAIALLVAWGLAQVLAVPSSRAQHTFDFTKTVDLSGSADYTVIQTAIDSIQANPTD